MGSCKSKNRDEGIGGKATDDLPRDSFDNASNNGAAAAHRAQKSHHDFTSPVSSSLCDKAPEAEGAEAKGSSSVLDMGDGRSSSKPPQISGELSKSGLLASSGSRGEEQQTQGVSSAPDDEPTGSGEAASANRRLSVTTPGDMQECAEILQQNPPAGPASSFVSCPAALEANQSNDLLVPGTISSLQQISPLFLLGLVPPGSRRASVMGNQSNDKQRGFDNKDRLAEIPESIDLVKDFNIGYACKKGLKPESPNQDDFMFVRSDGWGLYCVFDGHGPSGHDISDFVHRMLPYVLLSDPEVQQKPEQALKRAFRLVHSSLEEYCDRPGCNIDCALSGSTATVLLHVQNKLYVAHVGDSRAVLAKRDTEGRSMKAVNLTTDHKPTQDAEKRRIEAHGGEVRRLEGDIPHRVFVKGRMYPGLAMSRAIGDLVGAAVGVIPEPEIKVVDLLPEDAFIVVSTDGVWEFVSSQEAVDYIARKPPDQVQDATEMLAYESWRRWIEEEENVVDDVTCIAVWFKNN